VLFLLGSLRSYSVLYNHFVVTEYRTSFMMRTIASPVSALSRAVTTDAIGENRLTLTFVMVYSIHPVGSSYTHVHM
jgi:hypothetical protein